jgi:serine/threonine protein phosphatase 1
MGELVKILDRPIIGRLFSMGDLHGMYNLLMAKLEHIGFDFEKDLLVSVGDLVDRGSQNIQCVELLSKPWFVAVRGNHEELCILGLHDQSYKRCHIDNGGEWFYQLDSQSMYNIAKVFSELPIAMEISYNGYKYGFVHGHIEQNDWEEFKQTLFNSRQGNYLGRDPVDHAMWGRERLDPDAKQYMHVNGVDAVILGHTVTSQPCKRDNCIWIDTGAVYNGNLTIIEIGLGGALWVR